MDAGARGSGGWLESGLRNLADVVAVDRAFNARYRHGNQPVANVRQVQVQPPRHVATSLDEAPLVHGHRSLQLQPELER